jgi:glycosyltransferase involved in cell wall biosynthesis
MEARLLQAAGFEVTVITSGVHYMTGQDTRNGRGWCTEEWAGGIRILKTWGPTDFRRSTRGRLWHYLAFSCLSGLAALTRVGRVDRVFAGTDPISIMPVVFLVSRLKRAPLVLDERDLYPETAIALGLLRESWLTRSLFALQQFCRRQARGMLAATPGIRAKLIEYGHPADKIQLLYNADVFLPEQMAAPPETVSLREKTGRPFLVGYAGGLGQANDLMTLLKAAQAIRHIAEIGVVIIGAGETLPRLKQFCHENHLDNVFFLGPQPRALARSLLKQMDICVQPDPVHAFFSHALGSKTFDYHGLGKPTLFSGAGDCARLLAESGGGLTLPPEDDQALAAAILQLWQDETQCRTMAAAAQRWFVRHVSVAVATQIINKVMGYGAA